LLLYLSLEILDTLSDSSWVNAMHEEFENFERNQVWTLVDPHGVNVIGTKWVFKNKQGEDGEVVRKKARLVVQGYSQVEGQDFGEIFAPVAHIEVIRIFFSLCYFQGIQTLSNGCEKFIPKWCHIGGSVC
jgi:hypothetical protein